MSKKYFSTAWLVWLFPVFSIIITGSLYSQYLKHRGPLIHIYFNDATGIEVEKTVLRFRGVNVGKVEEILLSENDKGVSIVARLDREAKHLAVDGTQFWIVQPQVDFQGVRGLETLFRGSYIRILQGQGSGDAATEFKGHSETDESNSVVYYLRSPIVDSINPGDFIFYRGLKIGNVSEVSLAHTGQWIDIQIQIEKKYVKVIRTNTVFWQKSGVEAKLGLFGSKVKIGPLESLIRGGISLATPGNPGKIADAGSKFNLLSSPPEDVFKWNPSL